jgi:hypothetical protein
MVGIVIIGVFGRRRTLKSSLTHRERIKTELLTSSDSPHYVHSGVMNSTGIRKNQSNVGINPIKVMQKSNGRA